MTDTTTTKPPTAAATSPARQRGTTRPTVSVRPAAVGAANVATIAGATVVAAGGGAVLAVLAGGGALAATALSARKKGQVKRERSLTITRTPGGSTGRSSSGGGGGLGRAGAASPGSSRSAGSRGGAGRPSATRAGGGATGKPSRGLFSKSNRNGGGPGGGRNTGPGPLGRKTTTGAGHRRSGSQPGSASRSPLTADKVAAARRKLANRRQPGPRLSDAIRNATAPNATGKKPTARDAFRTARRAVTGDTPKNRGTVRRATAGLIAGGIAAGKVAYDARQRRKKRDAARQAKNDRIAAKQGQPRVGTAVRRAPGAAGPNSTHRKPAPQPLHRITADDLRDTAPSNVSKGPITMTNPLLAISEDFLAAAARNQPEGMLQVTAEAHLLPQVMENIVKAMKIRFDRAQGHALHESIKDMYGLVHKAQVSVQQAAEEIGPAIEKVHKRELDRLRNPRVGEEMWDVARNRGQL